MKKTDKIAYRQNTLAELQQALKDKKTALAQETVKLKMGHIKDTSIIKKIKYEIALISVIKSEKQHENK